MPKAKKKLSKVRVKPISGKKTKDVDQGSATEGKQSADGKTSNSETTDASREVTMLKFVSGDGEFFNVEQKVAKKFMFPDTLFKRAIRDDEPLHLDNIDSDVLAIMIKWAERHVDDPEPDDSEDNVESDEVKRCDDIDEWDNELLSVDTSILFRLMPAARYRKMNGLYIVAVKKTACWFKGKSVEEIRTALNIEPRE